MHKYIAYLILFFLSSVNYLSASELTIRSAVSESYKNGLQYKFIKSISESLGAKLKIHYAPFPRRLEMMKQGQIDLMVGLVYREDRTPYIHYIRPSYFNTPIHIFYPSGRLQKITRIANIHKIKVGVVRNTKFFEEIDQHPNKTEAATVEQLIKMLLSGRIDAFIHNQNGGLKKIAEMGYKQTISSFNLMPEIANKSYIGISRKSPLYSDPEILSKIEKIQSNYTAIRQKHYSDQRQ